MTIRFRQIDATNRGDHTNLREEDECLFLHEYTARKGYSFSDANQLISNLKKKKGVGGYQYKAPAIRRCARELVGAFNPEWLPKVTLVPVPPSKMKGDPEHDDRLLRVCLSMGEFADAPLDVREMVIQTASMTAAHIAEERPTVSDLVAVYEIDESLTEPAPEHIFVLDDMLTAGTHYRAMHTVLSKRFPGTPISGAFITRRVFANDRFEDFFGPVEE